MFGLWTQTGLICLTHWFYSHNVPSNAFRIILPYTGSRVKLNNQYVCEKTRVSFNVIKKSVCLPVCLSVCLSVMQYTVYLRGSVQCCVRECVSLCVCVCVCVCVEKGVWRVYLTQYKQLKIKINKNDRLDSAVYRYLCIEHKHCRILQQSSPQ